MTTWMDFQGPGFTLKVPSDWMINASPTVQAAFLAPNHGQPLRANLVITLRPVQADVTATEVAVTAAESQANEYSEYQFDQEKPITAGTIEGVYRRYRWTNDNPKVPLIQSQTFFVYQRVLFTLTATCTLTEQPQMQPILDEMVESFVIESQ